MDRPLFGFQELRLLDAKTWYVSMQCYASMEVSKQVCVFDSSCPFACLPAYFPVSLPTWSPLSPGLPVCSSVFFGSSIDSLHRNDTLICHLIVPMHPGWDGVGRWYHPSLPNTFANQMDHWLASTLSQRSGGGVMCTCTSCTSCTSNPRMFEMMFLLVSGAMLALSCRSWW